MAGVLGAASLPFIGCVALLAAMVLQILSFATPYWANTSKADIGLWRKTNCVNQNGETGCYKTDHMNYFYTEWIDAVRAMESLTLIFWSVPLVVMPVYIYVALGLYYLCTMGTMTAFTILGAITNLIGIIIFGAKIDENGWKTGWSLIVCVIACFLGIVAFVIFVIACCNRPKFAPERHYLSGFYVDPDKNTLYVIENVEPDKMSSMKGSHINHGLMVD